MKANVEVLQPRRKQRSLGTSMRCQVKHSPCWTQTHTQRPPSYTNCKTEPVSFSFCVSISHVLSSFLRDLGQYCLLHLETPSVEHSLKCTRKQCKFL